MTDSRGLHVRVLEQDYIDRSKGVQGVEYAPARSAVLLAVRRASWGF